MFNVIAQLSDGTTDTFEVSSPLLAKIENAQRMAEIRNNHLIGVHVTGVTVKKVSKKTEPASV